MPDTNEQLPSPQSPDLYPSHHVPQVGRPQLRPLGDVGECGPAMPRIRLARPLR